MLRLLATIWPALIPIALFALWYVIAVRRAKNQPEPILPKLRDGPWFITIVSTIGLAILCIFAYGLLDEGHMGEYIPAQLENGTLIDGEVTE